MPQKLTLTITRNIPNKSKVILYPCCLAKQFGQVHLWRDGTLYAPSLPTGANLDQAFRILGQFTLADPGLQHAAICYYLEALGDLDTCTAKDFTVEKNGLSLAAITLSDQGARGLREDLSGPAISKTLEKALNITLTQGFLLPDNASELRCLLEHLALREQYDLIITTGGTGVTSRDITPETTAKILDYQLPGFMQLMCSTGLLKTPTACLSRAQAGVLGRSLIINLPGSKKAVTENLTALLPVLPHALDKLHDDPTPCGG